MTIRIAVVAPDGTTTDERTFDQPYVNVGGGDGDDYVVAGLPPCALLVSQQRDGAAVDVGQSRIALALGEPVVLDLGTRKLSVCALDGARAARGACPRCGAAVSDRVAGGAYRSMVSRERACVACGTTVLELADTEQSIGAFSERPDSEWVTVSVAMSCPRCGSSLTRTSLRTAHGVAEVERCVDCSLIVLEPKDRVVLGG